MGLTTHAVDSVKRAHFTNGVDIKVSTPWAVALEGASSPWAVAVNVLNDGVPVA